MSNVIEAIKKRSSTRGYKKKNKERRKSKIKFKIS